MFCDIMSWFSEEKKVVDRTKKHYQAQMMVEKFCGELEAAERLAGEQAEKFDKERIQHLLKIKEARKKRDKTKEIHEMRLYKSKGSARASYLERISMIVSFRIATQSMNETSDTITFMKQASSTIQKMKRGAGIEDIQAEAAKLEEAGEDVLDYIKECDEVIKNLGATSKGTDMDDETLEQELNDLLAEEASEENEMLLMDALPSAPISLPLSEEIVATKPHKSTKNRRGNGGGGNPGSGSGSGVLASAL
jgi:hypothetical protein